MRITDYRAKARAALAGNWGLSIGVGVVASLLGGIGTSYLSVPRLSGTDLASTVMRLLRNPYVILILGLPALLGLTVFLIGGTLELGYCQYLLEQHDGRPLRFSTLFSRFESFGTGFCQKFLRGLYTGLWSLLFVIPGILAAYNYAMTPYILAEHRYLTVSQAIALSKNMMKGHRWELFCLDLSFIGWNILASLTLNLGHIALNPYKAAAHAAFYRNISFQYAQTHSAGR